MLALALLTHLFHCSLGLLLRSPSTPLLCYVPVDRFVSSPSSGVSTMRHGFSSFESALEAVAVGRPIILVDAAEREDEGDFFVAADRITPIAIHFMSSYGCGQLCVPIHHDIAKRLALRPIAATNPGDDMPGFTVPIDHRTCTTGISPRERAMTILSMLDPCNTATDFVQPGHVFPLVARPGGVLERTGHTEASVDLAQLAGLAPAGVICEICSSDGHQMAGREELFELAKRLELPIIEIDDVVNRRKQSAGMRNASCSSGETSLV